MTVIRRLHTAWGLAVFSVLFVLFLPPLLIPILFPSQFRLIGVINRWWAKLMFTFSFLSYEINYRAPLDRHRNYVFCPNHFSYLDIPAMGLNPVNAIFVGKSDMEKVPLFGFMYRKLHITVNRENLRSRGNTMIASMKAIDEGKSLMIFPEGGMLTPNAPAMLSFKDGAFRTAIEKKIPVVPVTIPFNWIILPDPENRLHRGTVKVIFHEPIETTGLTLADADGLKEKVYAIIDQELRKQNKL